MGLQLFTKKETCFIEGNDDAGKFDHEVLGSGDNVYRTGHSPEACAQLCLKDPRCKSFDAGRRDNANRIDYCYLSYKNEADVKAESPDLFVCDVSQGWDYFEKIPELLDESTRCRPGYISQSGHDLARSPCAKCRANTYSSDAGTRCTRCPLGKISMSGSGKIQDCFFPDASITSSTGALRLGSQWIGTYSTVITENGADRVAGGRAMIEVVSVSGFNVRILASLSHGEFCDKAGTAGQFSRECRVVSELFALTRPSNSQCPATWATDWLSSWRPCSGGVCVFWGWEGKQVFLSCYVSLTEGVGGGQLLLCAVDGQLTPNSVPALPGRILRVLPRWRLQPRGGNPLHPAVPADDRPAGLGRDHGPELQSRGLPGQGAGQRREHRPQRRLR